MKKIEKILDALNLIYYDYNPKTHTLEPDQNWSQDVLYLELIKITHALTTHKIHFFINEDNSILISESNSLISKIKKYVQTTLENIKNNRMNIYILSDKKVKWAKNLPVFKIETIEQSVDLSSYDALIFTSKNAIYAIDAMDNTWKKKPAYVIAPQTAKIVKHLKGTLAYAGKEKHGNKFALELAEKLKNKKVLYVRGAKVVSDLVNILNSHHVACEELIVYKTVCRTLDTEVKLPKNSTIIFSSPSTITCFLKNITWDESFKAVSIGDTTAQYFPSYITPVIADTTSLDSCVKKAIEINSIR
jgi:uroporphyrinogen-III synthase